MAAEEILNLSRDRRLNLDTQVKSAKLMSVDSNFEVRRLGAFLLLHLGENAVGCLTSFTSTVIEAMAGEKMNEIRLIQRNAVKGLFT